MTASRMRAIVASVRAALEEMDRLLDAADAGHERAPELMTVREYAEHTNVSDETVRRWLRAGLPCIRRGHVVRIKVAEADAWTPAVAIERSAREAAHRGGR